MLALTIKEFEKDEFGFKKADWPTMKYILAVHVTEDSSKVIHAFLRETEINSTPFQNLIDKLNNKPPQTLEESIFIATYFTEIAKNQAIIIEITAPITHENELINFVLKDSFGKIIYNYQLENFHQIIVLNDMPAAVKFRKAVNKKDNIEVEKSKRIAFENQITLFDLIQNHMPFSYCYYPNYFGGRVLWEKF